MTPSIVAMPGNPDIPRQLRTMAGPELERATGNALRRVARSIRTESVATYVQHGVVKKIFAAKPSGATKLVSIGRLRREGGAIIVTITATGLAGIMELGGRIKPHRIEPKNADVLAFGGVGGMVFAAFVNHPGGDVPQVDAINQALERWAPYIPEIVEQHVDQMVQKAMAA